MKQKFARPQSIISALLILLLLTLAACGGGGETTPEPEVPPTATLVPTLPPPSTPVPAEPVATEAPAETEEATKEVTAEATTEATTEAATEATEAEEVTASAEVTGTEEVVATEEVTTSEELTATEEITAAEEVTETEEITATEEVTETEEAETEAVSPSTGITESVAFTGTAEAVDGRVYFLQPTTNAIVPLTFTVVMSYTGVTLAPAADAVEGAGHLHVLLDTDFIEAGEAIPNDETHLHFGNGATSAELSLAPGSHILRLQYADNNHVALEGEQYRHEIIVNVVDGAPRQAVRLVSPSAGATVPTTFTVVMAATGLNVEPAGLVNQEAGHFHLLIDEPYVAPGEIVPTDETHLHFGKAQLTTTVTLEPGVYLLRLQMADGEHRALSGNEYRDQIEIVVEEGAPAQQVMFIKPADGATVSSPFLVAWAASGLIIESAGSVIRPEGGHLHVLVNEEFIAGGEAIPTDETHLHFGRGQTSTELTLEPGEYTLRLQMANGAHLAQDGAQYQDEITVTVR